MKKFLLLIIVIAIFFRTFQISDIPPGPTADEASIGYNAFSIFKTGADEYGEKFPILLRAYDDWRPAFYVYLVIPFVKLFGLTVVAVRAPSVILSILTVISTFYLVNELFLYGKDSISSSSKKQILNVSLLTTFLLAISPWHIYFSRIGHEWNGTLSFFVFGLLFFFRFLNNRELVRSVSLNLVLSAFFLGLSFNFYQSAKLFIPFLVLLLAVLFRKKLLENKIALTASIILGIVVIMPILVASRNPNALARFRGTNIFLSQTKTYEKSSKRIQMDFEENNTLGKLFDNRRVVTLLIPVHAYLTHFNPSWLYTNNGEEEFKSPDFGLFHLFELPLFLMGMLILIKGNLLNNKIGIFFLGWLILSPLPATISTGYPHAARFINLLPLPFIIEGFGAFYILSRLFPFRTFVRKSIIILAILTIFFSISWFYHSYFVNLNRELGKQFQYGAIEAVKYGIEQQDKYDSIIVSNTNNLFESYMFYLFASSQDPNTYQKKGGTKSGGFAETHRIGKFHFAPIIGINPAGKTLFVLNSNEANPESKILKKIYYPSGEVSIVIAE